MQALYSLKSWLQAHAVGKVPFRPLTGWNSSFEDIKSSTLASGACNATKDLWSRKDGCFEHNEEERETSINPLMCAAHSPLPLQLRLFQETRHEARHLFSSWFYLLHCYSLGLAAKNSVDTFTNPPHM